MNIRTRLAIVLLLPASVSVHGDEDRFNPPLRGGYLGIRVGAREGGLLVHHVDEKGAGARGGLRSGDLLTSFAGKSELDKLGIAGFVKFLRELPTERDYDVKVRRDGEAIKLRVEPDSAVLKDTKELAERLRSHKYFRTLADRQPLLGRIDDEFRASLRGKRRMQEAYESLNEVLDRLDVSHTAIIPPWAYESLFGGGRRGQGRYHLGVFLQRARTDAGDRYFVHSVMFGSPARKAGLVVGDEIVAVNSRAFATSPRRTIAGYEARHSIYTVQIDRDERVEIEYRRTRRGEVKALSLEANEPLGAVRSTELSVQLLDSPAGALGYIHLWNLVDRRQTRVFQDAVKNKLASAKGLVVDLRGRGGQVGVLAAIAEALLDDGRPATLLLDSETRSAKEVLAYRLKGKPGMRLVGETTAGAVRPAGYMALEGGTRVMIPVGDAGSVVRLTDGVDLEGRGVDPDVFVDFHLPFSAGRDTILERGVTVLEELIPAHRRRRRI